MEVVHKSKDQGRAGSIDDRYVEHAKAIRLISKPGRCAALQLLVFLAADFIFCVVEGGRREERGYWLWTISCNVLVT